MTEFHSLGFTCSEKRDAEMLLVQPRNWILDPQGVSVGRCPLLVPAPGALGQRIRPMQQPGSSGGCGGVWMCHV